MRWSLLGYVFALLSFATDVYAVQSQSVEGHNVDQLLDSYAKADSPGCATAVFRNGSVVYSHSFGLANIQGHAAITDSTRFAIASMSKQFTAAGVLILAQRRQLSLDDDVRTYVPELPLYSKPITIRHLLQHTSGLRDYSSILALAGISGVDSVGQQQFLTLLFRQKGLNNEPGAEFLYSNSNYLLLSLVIERVSRQTLREFLRGNIFEPLGMRSTALTGAVRPSLDGSAIGYSADQKGRPSPVVWRWVLPGDGGISTTIPDLLKWDENFYTGKVGGLELLRDLQTNGLLNDGSTIVYANGLFVEQYQGAKAVSHNGVFEGFRAELLRFPEHHLSVALLCNTEAVNTTATTHGIAAVYLGDKLSPAENPMAEKAAPLTEQQLQVWVGMYRNPASGSLREVRNVSGGLTASFGQMVEPLIPAGRTEFTATVGANTLKLKFERSEAGLRRMRQYLSGREVAVFDEVDMAVSGGHSVDEYVGPYKSDELPAKAEVGFENGELYLTIAGSGGPLMRIGKDRYAAGSLVIRFQRDDSGGIKGFALDHPRARNLSFDRIRAR